jgi:hypothetical protein
MSIHTKVISVREGFLGRVAEVKHFRGSLATPTYAISAHYLSKDVESWATKALGGVVEVYISLQISSLMRVAKDVREREKRERSIAKRVRSVPEDQLAVAVPVLEGGKDIDVTNLGDKELKTIVQQAAELVCHPRVDVVCVPMPHNLPSKILTFVAKTFIEEVQAFNVFIAPSIPNISRFSLEELVKLYRKLIGGCGKLLHNFLCVDYNNSNAITKYAYHNYVLAKVQELEEEYGEPTIVFGVNVKYSRLGPKYRELSARDLASYYVRVDIEVPNHRQPIPGEVAEKIKERDALLRYKVVDVKDYVYLSLQDGLEKGLVKKELVEVVRERGEEAEKIIKLVNARKILEEAQHLQKEVFREGESDPLQYIKEKRIAQIDRKTIDTIEKLSKRYGRETSLYRYLL